MVELNDKIPKFSLEGSDGKIHNSEDFLGKKTVIYFYPKDNTPGCTAQACNISDNYSQLKKLNINLVGVSADSLDSHNKFISKYNLPFVLLSDPTHEVAETFGAWGEKNLYGKISLGMKRMTFIFNENGEAIKVIKRAKSKTHGEDLLKFFDSL
ncbi:MAG: thioredoxin-dependent thiol peroxidase [Lachnospirales bacterium]